MKGKRERKRLIKEEERERKREKVSEKEIFSPGSSVDRADRMLILISGSIQLPQSSRWDVQGPGGQGLVLVGVPLYRSFFPILKIGFSLSVQISYYAQSFLSDLSGNGSKSFGGLWLS